MNFKNSMKSALLKSVIALSFLGTTAAASVQASGTETAVNPYPAVVNYVPHYGIQLMTNDGVRTNQYVLNGTSWQVSATKTATDGTVYDKLGDNQWVQAQYMKQVDPNNIPDNPNILTAKDTDNYSHQPYWLKLTYNYDPKSIGTLQESNIEIVSSDTHEIPYESKWKVSKTFVAFLPEYNENGDTGGRIMYDIGANQCIFGFYTDQPVKALVAKDQPVVTFK